MSNVLQDRLSKKSYLLADGATGTNFFKMGLQTGEPPELWNVDHPDRVAANYRSFIEAGSDIILTNSFGGNRFRLQLHHNQNRIAELNEAAARIAREVANETNPDVLIAGSMGPSGEILAPVGVVTVEEVAEAFREQAEALVRGGADILWIETISSKEELQAALMGASKTGVPIVCTMSFDTNGRTMMGLCPADVANLIDELNITPTACGSNCGVGPAETVLSIINLKNALGDSPVLVVAKGNCGIPYYDNGIIAYDGTPELMADYARFAHAAGANIIGGCCGTTPEHLRAMKKALDEQTDMHKPTLDEVVGKLGEVSTGARAQYGGNLEVSAGSASGAGKRTSRRNKE